MTLRLDAKKKVRKFGKGAPMQVSKEKIIPLMRQWAIFLSAFPESVNIEDWLTLVNINPYLILGCYRTRTR
jgi:hypothetical protein